MLATLVLSAALAASPLKIRVEVTEYITQKKVPGAQVTLREENGTAQLQALSDETGRAWFEVPHLRFTPVEIVKDGYVSRAELKPFRKEFKVLESRTPRGGEELFFEMKAIPRAWWEANLKARTKEQAIAIGNAWGRECGPGGPSSVTYDEKQTWWDLRYACMQVLVTPMSGTAHVRVPETVSATPLYPPEEALADALSSPLRLISLRQTDPNDVPECAYRNQKVLVLNAYCTTREIQATGITIIHPERGHVHLYAEAKEPISKLTREDYDNWKFSTHDPLPGARLDMTFEELLQHDDRRQRLRDHACYAGIQMSPNGACWKKTPEFEAWWATLYKPLLKNPPARWNELIRVLRKRAVKDGKPDPHR